MLIIIKLKIVHSDNIARLADEYEFDMEKISEAIEKCKSGEDRLKLENKIEKINESKFGLEAELESITTELSKRNEDKNAYFRELKSRNAEFR
jgi:chromosome segregation ATPase